MCPTAIGACSASVVDIKGRGRVRSDTNVELNVENVFTSRMSFTYHSVKQIAFPPGGEKIDARNLDLDARCRGSTFNNDAWSNPTVQAHVRGSAQPRSPIVKPPTARTKREDGTHSYSRFFDFCANKQKKIPKKKNEASISSVDTGLCHC